MKYWISVIVVCMLGIHLTAQTATETGNDPKAEAILDQLKAKYDTFLALEVDVNLTIELPEDEDEQVKGKIVQSGEKFRVDMGDYVAISDTETLWTVMRQNQVVQVSDAADMEDAEGAFMSPKDLVGIYKSGDYAYALTDEVKENGTTIQKIEFKPLTDDSDFFKIRILVDKNEQIINRIKVFSRDGVRYVLDVESFKPNKIYDSTFFQYDETICPDCDMEDLRY